MKALRGRGDDGITLPELLITMVLASLLGVAVVGTVSSVAKGSAAANNRIRGTERAQTVTDRVTRYVRAAHPSATTPTTAFDVADASTMTLYSDVGDPTGPRQITLSLTGSGLQQSLVERSTPPDTGSSYTYTGASTTRTLSPADVDVSAAGLFTYYDATGAVLPTPLSSAATRAQIARVRLTLTVREGGIGDPTTVTSLVYLRNVEYR